MSHARLAAQAVFLAAIGIAPLTAGCGNGI